MFKFQVLLALVLVGSCLSSKPKMSPNPGPCPKLPVTVPSTALKGKLVFPWGQNLFFPVDRGLLTEECIAQTLDQSMADPKFGVQLLGTDNKNFVVNYLCDRVKNGGHMGATAIFTTSKTVSPAVLAAIKKAHTDNKLDIKHLTNTCK